MVEIRGRTRSSNIEDRRGSMADALALMYRDSGAPTGIPALNLPAVGKFGQYLGLAANAAPFLWETLASSWEDPKTIEGTVGAPMHMPPQDREPTYDRGYLGWLKRYHEDKREFEGWKKTGKPNETFNRDTGRFESDRIVDKGRLIGSGGSDGLGGGAGGDTLGADQLVVDTIVKHEGFSAKPYWDVNHYRIGFGSDTWTDANGNVHTVTKNTAPVTRDDAYRDLYRRIPEFQQDGIIKYVGQQAWNQLSPETKAAVTSLAYNYGSIEDLPSLKRAIISAQPDQIAAAIKARGSDNGGINKNRRSREAAMVAPLSPVVPPPPNRLETALGAIQALTGADSPTLSAYAPDSPPLQASPLATGAATVGLPTLPEPAPRPADIPPLPSDSAIDIPSMRASDVAPQRAAPPLIPLPAVEPLLPTQTAVEPVAAPQTFEATQDWLRDNYGHATSNTDWSEFLPSVGMTQPVTAADIETALAAPRFDPASDPAADARRADWYGAAWVDPKVGNNPAYGAPRFDPAEDPLRVARQEEPAPPLVVTAPPQGPEGRGRPSPPAIKVIDGRPSTLIADQRAEQNSLRPNPIKALPPLAPVAPPPVETQTAALPTTFDANFPFGMPPDTTRLTPGQDLTPLPSPAPLTPNTWFMPKHDAYGTDVPPLPRPRPDYAPSPNYLPPVDIPEDNPPPMVSPGAAQPLFDAVNQPGLGGFFQRMLGQRNARTMERMYDRGMQQATGLYNKLSSFVPVVGDRGPISYTPISGSSRGNPSVTSITGNRLYYGDEGMPEVVKLLSGRHS